MEKTRCKAHPSEIISNFCANETCMIELCATCICDHTEYHHRHLNTLPRYENIKNTLIITNERLAEQKQQLNEAKNKIKHLMDQVTNKKKQIQGLLRVTKEDIFETINKIFIEMEKQLFAQLQLQKEKTGLHREEYLQQLYLDINEKALEVYHKGHDLNSFKYPEMIRKIYAETLEKNRMFLDEISKQIEQNQMFKMEVVYQPHALKQIAAGVKRIINTSFSYPSVRRNELVNRQCINNFSGYRDKSPKNRESQKLPLQQINLHSEYSHGFRRNNSFVRSGTERGQRSVKRNLAGNRPTQTSENWFHSKQKGTPKFHQTYGF